MFGNKSKFPKENQFFKKESPEEGECQQISDLIKIKNNFITENSGSFKSYTAKKKKSHLSKIFSEEKKNRKISFRTLLRRIRQNSLSEAASHCHTQSRDV